ncbi:hypothetical protein ET475_08480 [Microbacterium protaetiae]|uniref:DUF559 domain-containing protein n=1 Tax=Microbacterium protaetiae TaxID=2509458 RepID=A0A4P6ECQ4_9MICO|nr:hypothetical protein [Microbacterium protaetiae]QAY60022.1 hypothetical protein ET475_08480 [Microbacterium protaetiae]
MPARDLPSGLGPAFDVAAARRAGVSRKRLRARDLERPFHGVRSVSGASLIADAAEDAKRAYPRSTEIARIHERAAQYAPIMSENSFYIGVTAIMLWGGPLSQDLFRAVGDQSPVFDPDVLEVAVHHPRRAPRGRGIHGRAVRPHLVSMVTHPVSGLRLASPSSAWATVGSVLPHPYDLVAIADSFVRIARPPHGRPWAAVPTPLATQKQLTAAVLAGRRAGKPQLLAALPRVRTGSASRTETWTRLTLIDGGLPEPVLDHDVFDDLGAFLACVDMAYPQWKIAIEYEGTHHNDDGQWQSDIDRYARLEAAGWLVIRVTRAMLFASPHKLVARVRDAIGRRAR